MPSPDLKSVFAGDPPSGIYWLKAHATVTELSKMSRAKNMAFFHLEGKKIEKKEQFLNHAAVAMRFPSHFGGNWDAFYDCLTAASLENNVTLFTISDFARTLTTDSDGSDHAWGGNHLVLGGAVNGQRIYGNYPSLALGNALDVGRGRLIPQVAVDSYFAELALWFGVPKSSLALVLPNISAFYNTGSASPPLGFLA